MTGIEYEDLSMEMHDSANILVIWKDRKMEKNTGIKNEAMWKKILMWVSIIAAATVVIILIVKTVGCEGEGKKPKYKDTDVVATVNGDKILVKDAKFYIYMSQANYETYAVLQGNEIDWSSEATEEDGTVVNAANVLREEAIQILYKQTLFMQQAKEWGITLNDEEKAEVEEEVQKFYTDSDDDLLDKLGADRQLIHDIYTDVKIYTKVCEKILSEKPVSVTDEEAHQGMFSMAIIDPETTDSPADTGQAILDRVKGGESISYVADKYGVEVSVGNVGKGTFDNELGELCLSLKTGESGMVTVGDYTYVVFCEKDDDKEATEIAKEQLIEEKEAIVIDEYFTELKKKAEIELREEVLNSIEVKGNIITKEDVEKLTTEAPTTKGDAEKETAATK